MEETLKTKLMTLAAMQACCDDEEFDAFIFSGGDFDDAYSYGLQDGEILLAREILDTFCIKY